MTQPTLKIGDWIDWNGETMRVSEIEGEFAVWYGDHGRFANKRIARCHISDYPSSIRLVPRSSKATASESGAA